MTGVRTTRRLLLPALQRRKAASKVGNPFYEELLRALRQEPEGRRIPIVVLTTSVMPSDITQAYELGANAFVEKPAKFQDLVELVKAIQAFWLSFNVLHPELR